MDRFAMRFELGYVDKEQEVAILSEQNKTHPINTLSACVNKDDVITMMNLATEVRISEELKDYIVSINRATRVHEDILNGASPRASLALMKAAQALAMFDDMRFVTPDHIQEIAVAVIAHRLMLNSQARFSGRTAKDIVEEVLKAIAVPG